MRMRGGDAGSCWMLLTLSLKGRVYLCLSGILADDWSVHLPSSPICAVVGSSVVLPCSYDYPQRSNGGKEEVQLSPQEGGHYKVLSEMWCLEDSRCITPRYVFHSSGILLDPSYHHRVEYLGRPGTKNCSLRISDVRQSDSGAYVFYLVTSHPTQKMPEQRGVQLLVADSSTAVTVLSSPPRGITEGEALRLACCSPAAGPQARFRWYKGTSASVGHTGPVWSIGEATSDESGSYYCQLQTGHDVHNSTALPVDVEYSPRDTVVSVSHPGELQDGLPVTLTCSSDANPAVRAYVWYQGAACLPTADKSFHSARQTLAAPIGRGLTRANVTTEEDGLHCCVARNRHGSQTDSTTVTKSRGTAATTASGSTFVIIGVSIGVLLAVTAIVAFFMIRRRKSSRHHSYVLTATAAPTATAP
ncbi:carcinoembryonic antigen-related cell adhesion molecule 6-like [Brachionichthys hirsutus]|uniref:carcinoembryonic antigen-related cell adhesion molecule 6-like n=1 Tax=Brachionichthys hirsutus TaxID=412623 RepID=UPI003604712D